jgi:hypothetical protein
MPYRGRYTPISPYKYIGDHTNIIYRSLWERKFMIFCDTNESILKWSSEEIAIPYYFHIDKKMHKYFVDFVIQIKEKNNAIKTYLVEIKPFSQTIKPIRKKTTKKYLREVLEWEKNKSKWASAIKYAKDKNWEFKILTEKDLFK